MTGRATPDVGAGAGGTRAPAAGGQTPLGVWIRLLLGIALGIGLTQWPYRHSCGLPLLAYGAAVVIVFVAGIWAAGSAWKHRRGAAHVIAVILAVWGLALAADLILPRIGYAAEQATWLCPQTQP